MIIVDDVITTAGSTLKAIAAAERAGLVVAAVICLLDREEGGAEALSGYPFFPLFPPQRDPSRRRMTVQSRGPRRIPVLVELRRRGMAEPLVPLAQLRGSASPSRTSSPAASLWRWRWAPARGSTLATAGAARCRCTDFLGIEVAFQVGATEHASG